MTEPTISSLADIPLFSGQSMHEYFCRLHERAPSVMMNPSTSPYEWASGPLIDLPEIFQFAGTERSTEQFLEETDTAALLVLKDGEVRHERYALSAGPDTQWLSMSVAKSFISALVGIAIDEGLIGDIKDKISDYTPVEPGSAYDGVSILDVLQMSSGARWNEDYNDPQSDIFRLSAASVGHGTLDDFVASSYREQQPGVLCRYNSTDTQALGSLLVGATGRTIANYMQEKLVEPLGLTSTSHWLIDGVGRELAYMGLNMTARDYAKLGELYRNGGVWQGKQIVPAEYVAASTRANAPHTQPGQPWISHHQWEIGYGYQWWIPAGDRDEFSAIGIYNQFVYVHPTTGVVIVKLSSNRSYGTSTEEHTNREIETLAFLRHVARRVN